MKKSMIIMTAIVAMAAVQPALASDDTRKMHGSHMHGALHDDKDAKQKSTMHDDGHMQDDMGTEKGMNDHVPMKGHGPMKGDMSQMQGVFLVKKEIDGFTVSFHVMKAKEGMEHGGTHNFMVKVEKDGKALTNLMINSKVTHPNKESESKMLMKMGDWYMAAYDLGHEGRHQLMVLFKSADGAKHYSGVWYPKE